MTERGTEVVAAGTLTAGRETIAAGRVLAIRWSASRKTVYVTTEKYPDTPDRYTPNTGVCVYR